MEDSRSHLGRSKANLASRKPDEYPQSPKPRSRTFTDQAGGGNAKATPPINEADEIGFPRAQTAGNLGTTLSGIMEEIRQESQRKIKRVEKNLKSDEFGLQQLKDEFTVRYSRLTLNVETSGKMEISKEKKRVPNVGVTLHTLHESSKGDISPIIVLVGRGGQGKTTSALKYAKLAMTKQVSGPSGVLIIVFIEGRNIEGKNKCTPFDLLFSDQFANVLTTKRKSEELEEWVAANPSQVLVIIDGINEIDNFPENTNALVGLNKESSPLTILLNILRCNIYNGMWVMCTTTPQWLWKLDKSEIPMQCVITMGFRNEDASDILSQLTGRGQMAAELMARFPDIKTLCESPAILGVLARLLQPGKDLTESRILLEILDFLDSQHTESCCSNMQCIEQVAHNAAKQDRLDLKDEEILMLKDTSSTTLSSTAHLISAMPVRQRYSLMGRKFRDRHLNYTFNGKAIRDTLAALHLVSSVGNLANLLRDALAEDAPNFRLLAIAFIANESCSRIVASFSNTSVDKLSESRNEIARQLASGIQQTVKSISWIRLLSKCQGLLPQLVVPKSIKIKAGLCDGNDVLSVAKSIPSITKVSGSTMEIHIASLHLLQRNFDLELGILKVIGKMENGESKDLSRILLERRNSESGFGASIQRVVLTDYGMSYYDKIRSLVVDQLEYSMLKVIKGLLSHLNDDDRCGVKITKINLAGCSESVIGCLVNELIDCSKYWELIVEEVVWPNLGSVPSELLKMLTVTPSLRVKSLKYGDVICKPQPISKSSEDFGLSLQIGGILTTSPDLLSLIQTGEWKQIISQDFSILLKFTTVDIKKDGQVTKTKYVECLAAAEKCATNSYYEIVKLMVQLRGNELAFSDVCVRAEYEQNATHESKVLSLRHIRQWRQAQNHLSGVIQNRNESSGARYVSVAKAVFQITEASILQFGSLALRRDPDCSFQGNPSNLIIDSLDESNIPTLAYLQTTTQLPSLKVNNCEIRKSDIPSFCEGHCNVYQISTLTLVEEEWDDLKNAKEILRKFKCTAMIIRIYGTCIRISPSQFQGETIKIDRITADEIDRICPYLIHIAPVITRICVCKLVVLKAKPGFCENIFKYFTNPTKNNRKITLQIDAFVTENALPDSLLLCLRFESELLKISSLVGSTQTTAVDFNHSSNNMITGITIIETDIDALLQMGEHVRCTARNCRKLSVNRCTVPDLPDDKFQNCMAELNKILCRQQKVCEISHLHVAGWHPEVFQRLDKPLQRGRITMVHFRSEFVFTYKKSGQSFHGSIDKISTEGLKRLIEEMGRFLPGKLIVQQCEIGRTDKDIEKRVTGPKDEFYDKMMKMLLEDRHKETIGEIEALNDLLNQYKILEIQTLTVNGRNEDLETITDVIINGSPSQTFGSNQLEQVGTLRLQTVSLDNHRVMDKILNSGRRLEANCLRIDKSKEDFTDWASTMEVVSNNNFKATNIETECKLSEVVGTIVEVYRVQHPQKIISNDGIFDIANHPQLNAKLLVTIKGDIASNEVQQLSREIYADVTTKEEVEQYQNVVKTRVPEVCYDDVRGAPSPPRNRMATPPTSRKTLSEQSLLVHSGVGDEDEITTPKDPYYSNKCDNDDEHRYDMVAKDEQEESLSVHEET